MLPVFIHHELDQKPQTGGSAKQRYVKTCVAQAEKYNAEVLLFGDKYMQPYSRNWIDVSAFTSPKWEAFLSVFENYSTYPDAWAKGIFKRFYIFEEYMKEHKIEKCVILDSDVLVWCDFEKLDFVKNVDVVLEIDEDQHMVALPFENEYRWAACAGVALMTLTAISDFTAFVIETYQKNKLLLLEKWDIHKKYHLPGGVCEMSLLYLWKKEKAGQYQMVNFGLRRENVQPCLVINSEGKSYEIQKNFVTMQNKYFRECLVVKFKGQMPYVIEENTSRLVKILTLHFGGKTKMLMENFSHGKTYSGLPMLDWYYWIVRGKLSKVKNTMLKGMGMT